MPWRTSTHPSRNSREALRPTIRIRSFSDIVECPRILIHNRTDEPDRAFEDRMWRMFRPLRIFHERFVAKHILTAEIGDGLLQLWVEDIDEEVVQERSQGAHWDIRCLRYNIFEMLEESK